MTPQLDSSGNAERSASASLPQGVIPPGLWKRLTRRMVKHPRVVSVAGIVVWLGVCVVVFRWGMGFPREGPAGMEWLTHLRSWGGWVLSAVAEGWLIYGIRRCNREAKPAEPGRPERPTLSSLMCRRIYEREPVRKELLPGFGCVGVAGVVVGMLLTLWIALATSGGGMEPWRGALVVVAMLALACVGSGVLVLRDVFYLANDDYFIAGREEQVAAELEAKQRKEAEADSEYKAKTVGGWEFWILYAGFIGGLYLLGRYLSEPEGIAAFQTSMSALLVTAVWIYTGRLRPRGWRWGRALTVVGAVTFVDFTVHTWGLHWLPMVLGLVWGALIAGVATPLYLRRLSRCHPDPGTGPPDEGTAGQRQP